MQAESQLHAVVAAAEAVDVHRVLGDITPEDELLRLGRSLKALRAAEPKSLLGKHINEHVEIPDITQFEFNIRAWKRLRGLAYIICEWSKQERFEGWEDSESPEHS